MTQPQRALHSLTPVLLQRGRGREREREREREGACVSSPTSVSPRPPSLLFPPALCWPLPDATPDTKLDYARGRRKTRTGEHTSIEINRRFVYQGVCTSCKIFCPEGYRVQHARTAASKSKMEVGTSWIFLMRIQGPAWVRMRHLRRCWIQLKGGHPGGGIVDIKPKTHGSFILL